MTTKNVEKEKIMKKKWKELTKQEKSERLKNAIGLWVLISFLIPVIFLTFKIVSIDSGNIVDGNQRTKSDYVLMLIQCLLGIVAMIIPNMVVKKKNIQIPSNMYIFYLIFLYCAIFLGEVKSFYYIIPQWDTILHTFSGVMIGALGFSFVSMFNKTEDLHLQLSPFFVAMFAFMFAVTLGVIWEIYEFTFDGLLGLNMQKFMMEPGDVMLVGRAALEDTMEDLIVDTLGALFISVAGYFSLKLKNGWIEKFMIKRKNN